MQDAPAPLRSFGRRHGRKLRDQPQWLVDNLLPSLRITLPEEGRIDISALKGDKRALWLEIGFGSGEHLLQLAQKHPDVMVLGAEPYMNGVARLLASIAEQKPDILNVLQELGIPAQGAARSVGFGVQSPQRTKCNESNIRIFPDDVRLLMQALPDASLERIYLLFPDPWPKRKQQKRRILNYILLDEIARLLIPGGVLQLATDHYDYSVWMLEHLHQRPEFIWQADSCRDWHEPPEHWVATKYETKTRAEGRQPVYLRYLRKP
jgi:tRNA (guanine-N7-)-methyltransferase